MSVSHTRFLIKIDPKSSVFRRRLLIIFSLAFFRQEVDIPFRDGVPLEFPFYLIEGLPQKNM